MFETLITVVHVSVALFMILVVLVQGGNSGGVSAALGGGGNSSGVFGATGATTILGKMTYGAAIIFMSTSLSLSIIKSKSGHTGLTEKLSHPDGKSTVTTPLQQEENKSAPVMPEGTTTTPQKPDEGKK